MVFLNQNTQMRDTMALKLNELIMATKGTSNHLAGIEDATDTELAEAKEASQERCRL
jgi:low affinity Fe/Cu permease